MSIFDVIKRVINRGGYDAADIRAKKDLFLFYDRLTTNQYDELIALIEPANA